MKHTPRMLAVLLAFVLIVAACGGSSNQTIAGDGPDADPTSTPAPAEPTATPEPPRPTPTVEPNPALDALDAARARWAAIEANEYAYTYLRNCECSDEARGPVRVRVADGEVASATYFGLPADVVAWTAEGLFDDIERTITDGLEVAVTYDHDTGFPTVVRLDIASFAVDGGIDLTTSSLVIVDQLRAELADARARWEAAAIDDYDLTYQEICFCPEIVVTVTVRDGQVVAKVAQSDFETTAPGMTVPMLFDQIADALDGGAFSVIATYDTEFGHPIEYYIDVEEMMADEEFGIAVIDLVVQP